MCGLNRCGIQTDNWGWRIVMRIALNIERARLLHALWRNNVIPIVVAKIAAMMMDNMVMVPVVNHVVVLGKCLRNWHKS